MIVVIRDKNLNKINFFLKGKKVYPSEISGNIYTFKNGNVILV